MVSAALAAAPKIAPEAFPKPQYFTAPSGRRYKWGKATPPTQADLDAIVAYEKQVDTDSKAKGNRGKVPLMASEPGNPEKVNIVKGNGSLKDELIRKTTQGLARAGYNPALTPAEDPRSGFQKALVGESETSRLLNENAQRLVNDPALTGIGNAFGEALGLTQALKLLGANQQAGQVQSLVSNLANPANLSGIAPLMQAAANPAQAADENFYNAFDASKPPEERAQAMFNIALFVAAHGAGTTIGGITVTDKIKDAAMAFKEARTPINRKALEDALYTARQTAAPTKGVPDPLKPAPGLNVPRTQVGPPEAKLGTIQGASTAGRRAPTRAIPVEDAPGVKTDKSTQTILNRAEVIRAKNELDAATARRADSQKPTLALPGRTPEPAPVAVQPKPVVAKATEPKVEAPTLTPRSELKQGPKNIRDIWDGDLYREVSNENIDSLTHSGKYWSNNPDTALGQGSNKGIVVRYRPSKSDRSYFNINTSKPGWEFAYDSGHAEIVPMTDLSGELVSLTIKKNAGVDPKFVRRYDVFTKEGKYVKSVDGDGNTVYTAKKFADPSLKPVETSPNISTKSAKEPWEMTRGDYGKTALSSDEATLTVQQIRAGNAYSKRGGKASYEEPTGPLVKMDVPIDSLSPSTVEYMRQSTNSSRVNAYSSRKIETPVYLKTNQKGELVVSDGGHRLMGAMSRGDKSISALLSPDVAHKISVETALKEGKPVPASVLADYPDLAAKYKPVPKVETPTPKTGLDAAYEAAVKNRAKGGTKGGTGNKNTRRGSADLSVADAITDYAIIAAWHIRNGARTGRDVLTKLLADHPYDADLIKANLSQIIGDARQSLPEKPYRIKPNGEIVGPEQLKSSKPNGTLNEKTNQQTIRDVQEGQGIRDQGTRVQGQGYGQKANAFKEKGQVTPESVGVKSAQAGTATTTTGTRTRASAQKSANVNKPTLKEPQLTVEPPPVIKSGESPARFAASNAASNDIRTAMGLDKLPDADKRKWDEVLTSATKTYDGDAIDARIKDVSKPLSDVETAQAAMRSADLSQKLKAATGDIYDDLETKLLNHTIALRNAGTEQGRALAARNMAVLEDYSLDGMYRRYVGASKAKSAADISPDVRAQIKGISDSYDQLNTRVAELQKRFDEQAVKLAEAERGRIATEVRTRGQRKAAVKVTRDELVARIRKNQSQYISSVPIQGLIDSADDIKALVRLTIEDGITDLSEVYKAVSAQLKKGGVDLTRSEFDGVLAGAYKKTPGLKRDLTEYQKLLKAARESGEGKDAMVWQRVRRLDERIKAQQYDNLKTTPIGKALTDAEIALKAKQVEFDRLKTQAKVKAEYDAMSPLGRGYHNAKEAGNAVRSVVASTDVSAPLNQGFFYTLSHPGKSASAMWETMGAIKGDEALNRIMGKIRNNQYYELGRGSKLQVGAAAGDYADDFMTFGDSKLAKVITGKYSPIGASERVYKAYVTKIRMDMFADLAKAEERASGGRLKRTDYEAIAEFVNTVTGTTTNKYVEAVSEPAGALMFAPKYTVARVKTVFATPAINAARVGNYRLAGRILGEYAKVAGAIGGAIYVANKNGANVELDPRSPKFMKGRIGNVEFNADQGLGQTYRLLAAILNPALDRIPGLPNVKGKKSSSYGAIDNYFTGKLAPVPRIAKNAIDGKAYGKSYDVSKQEGWINLGLSLLPISVQNGLELKDRKDISNEQKAAIGLAGFLGVKIDSNPPRK